MAQKTRSRRKRGSGTIFQTKTGLYAYEVDLGTVNGKRVRKRVYGTSIQEVKAKVQDLRAEGGGEIPLPPPPEPPTLSDYAARWLSLIERRVESRLAKATTHQHYAWCWGHAAPHIGNVRIDRLDRATVLRLIDSLQAAECSAATINTVIRKLGVMVNDAIRDGVFNGVRNNSPFHMVGKFLPKHTKQVGRALSPEEIKRFYEAAKGDPLEAAWHIGIDGGLRISEIFSLQWDDIDFENKTISIKRQAQDLKNSLVVSDLLKTESAYRVIGITSQTLAALERRRATMKRKSSIWVFSSIRNPKTPTSPRSARRRSFARITQKAGLEPLHPHDLRRTCASVLHALGVPESVTSQRLGHANSQITKALYTFALKNQANEAVGKLETFLTA